MLLKYALAHTRSASLSLGIVSPIFMLRKPAPQMAIPALKSSAVAFCGSAVFGTFLVDEIVFLLPRLLVALFARPPV